MNLEAFFGYSSLIHFSILFLWFFLFIFARKWIYRLHTKWFDIQKEKFDTIHYRLMGLYKLLILLFAFIPYLTLLIIR